MPTPGWSGLGSSVHILIFFFHARDSLYKVELPQCYFMFSLCIVSCKFSALARIDTVLRTSLNFLHFSLPREGWNLLRRFAAHTRAYVWEVPHPWTCTCLICRYCRSSWQWWWRQQRDQGFPAALLLLACVYLPLVDPKLALLLLLILQIVCFFPPYKSYLTKHLPARSCILLLDLAFGSIPRNRITEWQEMYIYKALNK